MKGTIYILSALLLAGCAEKKQDEIDNRPLVFTSILPQTGLAKSIAGDHMAVYTLVGEGQSPHSYEPTAKQLAKLAKADGLLTIGVPFEQQLLKKIEPLYPDLPIINTRQGITLRTMPHAHHGEQCSHDHGEPDPHVWLVPENARQIAENITHTLVETDPDNAATYQQNYETLANELEQLDAEIRALLAPYKGSRFYVFHPSFGYFADAYGLEQIPVELDGKSPSPRQLAQLIDQARADQVKVIFVQQQFPAGSARAVADAIGGSVVQLDPLAEDCIANLRLMAETVAKTLKP